MKPVDIIIPVFRGLDAARRCLDSVLGATSRAAHEVIVVNDASPEADLVRHVHDLAERGRVTLIEQPSPRGYAAAVNRALAANRDRDAVILRSDAEVANDWLDRLAAHARSGPGIGAVAPFTNRGGVAGYPLLHADNDLPPGHTVGTLDALFRRANSGAAAAVPTVFGPCIYFRRDCLDTVGALDAAALGSDYGVEADLCLRAGGAGFRHLVAGDVFVGHIGHAFYGAEAADVAARGEKALSRLYPAYPSQRADALAADRARPFARRVDMLRLAESPRHPVVFISHPWGGGIRRHMTDLAALVSDRCEVLFLEPAVGDTVRLHWPRRGEGFCAYYTLPAELPALAETLHALGVVRLHFHHVHLLPSAILELPSATGLPYDCTLHDYYAICPQYHLVTEDGRYCGEPDPAGCAACLTRRPGMWGLDITAWRGTFGRLLRGADRRIAPSHDVAQRIRRYLPELSVLVWPHPEPWHSPPPRVARIVILGNLSPEKGLRVVVGCAEDARVRQLSLAFRILGSTTEPVPQSPAAPLTIHGQYDDAELAQLLAREKPDVILFPAQVPETYSYTLSVALASGLPVVASALGALPERLAGHPRSATIPWDAPPAEWNAALMRAAGIGAEPPERKTATIPIARAVTP